MPGGYDRYTPFYRGLLKPIPLIPIILGTGLSFIPVISIEFIQKLKNLKKAPLMLKLLVLIGLQLR